MTPVRTAVIVVGCLLACPAAAHAGMSRPVTLLTELAKTRLQNLSFFLAGFLLSSLFIQVLWNSLRRDVPSLPRLSYPRAVGVVGLWGLLFILVLTMISGARELLTPGAWEPSGVGYRLAQKPNPEAPDETSEEDRRLHLARLKAALWQYARDHQGQLPSQTDPAIPERLWRLPDASGMHYVYRGGAATAFDGVLLAYEPEIHPERWALLTDGEIRRMTSAQIARALAAEKK